MQHHIKLYHLVSSIKRQYRIFAAFWTFRIYISKTCQPLPSPPSPPELNGRPLGVQNLQSTMDIWFMDVARVLILVLSNCLSGTSTALGGKLGYSWAEHSLLSRMSLFLKWYFVCVLHYFTFPFSLAIYKEDYLHIFPIVSFWLHGITRFVGRFEPWIALSWSAIVVKSKFVMVYLCCRLTFFLSECT